MEQIERTVTSHNIVVCNIANTITRAGCCVDIATSLVMDVANQLSVYEVNDGRMGPVLESLRSASAGLAAISHSFESVMSPEQGYDQPDGSACDESAFAIYAEGGVGHGERE